MRCSHVVAQPSAVRSAEPARRNAAVAPATARNPVLGDAHSAAETAAERAARNFVASSVQPGDGAEPPPGARDGSTKPAPGIVRDVLSRPGAHLPHAIREQAESFFAHNFSDVRVHTDELAAASARAVGARAWSAGRHIAFDRDAFDPHGEPGRRTLAHELAHVAQNQPGVLRRQGGGATASVEVCFVPIRQYRLSQVGGVHTVLNVHGSSAVLHAEVDPAQHTGIEDPAAAAQGAGRVAGLHSHVVIGPGARSAGTCQTLSVTQTQADAVIAAARSYESMDVVYEAPGFGPNSNSFGEWALHEAGISTASITVPSGALGWDWYPDHSAQRNAPPRVARTFRGTTAVCAQPHAKAASFRALVDLIGSAETQMIACGISDAGARLNVLRGIFYGTPWSRDFGSSQQSHIRNQMFNVYSGTTQPRNPIECMDCGTFLSIGESQDVTDRATGRHVDVGHLLIGMDARRSWTARTVAQPVGQVTGLEAATWAGDLGGGAARLAMRRLSVSTAPATDFFRGSDYGGSINLEGDVAGYAAGVGSLTRGTAPPLGIPAGGTIADALDAYFFASSTGTPAGWDSRCRTFLTAVGGAFSTAGALTNRADVLAYLTEQIHDFGCWYMVNYQRQNSSMNAATLEAASRHIAGASAEIAEVFLAALERCSATPSLRLTAGTAPTVSAAGSPTCGLARVVPEAARAVEETRREVEQHVIPEAQRRVDQAEGWIRARQREAQRWWQQLP